MTDLVLHVYRRNSPDPHIAASDSLVYRPWLAQGVAMDLAVTVHVFYHSGVHMPMPTDVTRKRNTLASRLAFAGLR